MADGRGHVPAFVAERRGGEVTCSVEELEPSELGEGDLLVEVAWSSVNYKDALATRPGGGVARLDRLVPGIDLAGCVVESGSAEFRRGDEVLVHGHGLGVSHHGGFARYARVPSAWVLPLPAGLDARAAMAFGTAGFTAMLSVERLERNGVVAGAGPVVVTGATGGVGSFAVALLSMLGYEVVASTGKVGESAWLRELGAATVEHRDELSRPGRPLEAQRFAGAVDAVGGDTLAGVLRCLRRGGVVAASGVTGGAALETTVFPFILRAVTLVGVDSTEMADSERAEIWRRVADSAGALDLDLLVAGEVSLGGLPAVLDRLLAGAARGRYLVLPDPE